MHYIFVLKWKWFFIHPLVSILCRFAHAHTSNSTNYNRNGKLLNGENIYIGTYNTLWVRWNVHLISEGEATGYTSIQPTVIATFNLNNPTDSLAASDYDFILAVQPSRPNLVYYLSHNIITVYSTGIIEKLFLSRLESHDTVTLSFAEYFDISPLYTISLQNYTSSISEFSPDGYAWNDLFGIMYLFSSSDAHIYTFNPIQQRVSVASTLLQTSVFKGWIDISFTPDGNLAFAVIAVEGN